jgi:hypothetical protein
MKDHGNVSDLNNIRKDSLSLEKRIAASKLKSLNEL